MAPKLALLPHTNLSPLLLCMHAWMLAGSGKGSSEAYAREAAVACVLEQLPDSFLQPVPEAKPHEQVID